MAHERWVKRMDDAVASSWLRGLRTDGRAQTGRGTAKKLRAGAQRAANAPLGSLDRTVAANADR
ncbi:MAG: hypothetical protein M3389_11835 [Actinomycetota bacterium]|nr:hypothetical protein [Actinomycetota bacterium]